MSPPTTGKPDPHRAIILGVAGVAQSVEQLIRNEKVGCSIHLSGTNKNKDLAQPNPLGFFLSHADVTVDVRVTTTVGTETHVQVDLTRDSCRLVEIVKKHQRNQTPASRSRTTE